MELIASAGALERISPRLPSRGPRTGQRTRESEASELLHSHAEQQTAAGVSSCRIQNVTLSVSSHRCSSPPLSPWRPSSCGPLVQGRRVWWCFRGPHPLFQMQNPSQRYLAGTPNGALNNALCMLSGVSLGSSHGTSDPGRFTSRVDLHTSAP